MKNFHLPLEEKTYVRLKTEAQRLQLPATAAAREAIDQWLLQQQRQARHDAIAVYATEMAGTQFDIDVDLEAAGVEHLIRTAKAPR